MFTIGITKGRWNSMVTELQQFRDDYDKNQPLWKVLPEFVAEPALRARRPARPVPRHPRGVSRQRRGPPDHRDVPLGHGAGHETRRRLRQMATARSSACAIDELEGRVTSVLLTPTRRAFRC